MKNLQSVMSRIQLLLFGFISSILIVLFSIVGCSDPSHTGSIVSSTGSMLTHADVDDYLTSIRGGRYCIHNDTDSTCIDLVPLVNGAVDTNGPIIHIYPEKTVYLFHHEGKPIVRAERVGDTTDFVETLTEADQAPTKRGTNTPGNNNNGNNGGNNNGNNGDDNNGNNGDDNNGNNGGNNNSNNNDTPADADNPDNTDPTDNTSDGHGWLIWIYYPEGKALTNSPTLRESNVTVTINGKQLTDGDITGFAQFIGTDGEKGIQFFYPTESAELLDLRVQMVGITDREDDVSFYLTYLWHSY